MEKKSKIYLAIIVLLIIAILLISWKLIVLNNKCKEEIQLETAMSTINTQIMEQEINYLVEPILSEKGIYNRPIEVIFGEKRSTIIVIYVKNKFNITKKFDIEVLPDYSIQPVIPYDKLELIYDFDSFEINPNASRAIALKVYPLTNDFESVSLRDKAPQYIINIKTDGRLYASGKFIVLATSQKEIEERREEDLKYS